MKNLKFISVIKIGILAAFFLNINFVNSQSHLSYENVFKHSVNVNNTRGHVTSMANGNLNKHKDILLFVTHDYGTSGPYVTQPLGVWFNGSAWTIFSQDKSPIKTGTKFNVLGVNKSDDAYVHIARKKVTGFLGVAHSNIRGSATRLNHPSLNYNPNAAIIITQNWGYKGPYNTSHTGVYYANGYWHIYNLNGRAMPEGAKFNVLIRRGNFKYRPARGSIRNHVALINSAKTNGQNKSMVFTTFNSENSPKYYNNGIGVYFIGGKWSIYNENKKSLKGNESYNILWY